MNNIHIALDSDRTLAHYESSWRGSKIGPVFPKMLEKAKYWLNKGYRVSIFTARVSSKGRSLEQIQRQESMIRQFLIDNGLPLLEIISDKQPKFTHFVDDKAVVAIENTGEILNCPEELI